jgi:hypothetical protein
MAFSFLVNTHAQSTDGNPVTTGSVDTTGVNLIPVHTAALGNLGGVTDSKGNSYSLAVRSLGSGKSALNYVQAPTVGSGHTFTGGTGNGSFPSIEVAGFSGSDTSPLDVTNSSNSTGTTIQPGSITPGANNELVVAGCAFEISFSPLLSVDGGFSITDNDPGAFALAYGGVLSYLIQTTAAAANPTFTGNSSGPAAATIASFKAATAATFNAGWAYGATKIIGGVF